MASIATYGSFVHADNEVNLVSASYQTNYSPRRRKLTQTHTLQLSGELIYDGPAEIVPKTIAMFNAYDQDGQDFTYTVGGVVAHRLPNGSSLSGVKVINKRFPIGTPDQLATTRTFGVTLQATYDVCEDNIVQWTENLEVVGTGGPVKTVVNTIFGPFQVYYAPSSAVMTRQYGSAIGFNNYPTKPPPIGNADAEFLDRRVERLTSGIQQGTGIKFYRIDWSYSFVFAFINGFYPTSK